MKLAYISTTTLRATLRALDKFPHVLRDLRWRIGLELWKREHEAYTGFVWGGE